MKKNYKKYGCSTCGLHPIIYRIFLIKDMIKHYIKKLIYKNKK